MELRIEDCDDATFRLVAPHLREEDQEEWRMSAGDTPAGLYASGHYSLPSGADSLNRIVRDASGVPLAVWGVSPAYPPHRKVGWVWLVATPAAVPRARAIHQHLKVEFGRIQQMYPKLITASYLGNPVHQAWLKWLGFEAVGAPFTTPFGGQFQPFTYRSQACAVQQQG